MADVDLDDEMVKLVSYTIVSIKRGSERIMPGGMGAVIITDRMSKEAFISWIVATYLQSKAYEELSGNDRLSEEDRKYLRVDYAVPRRWSREPFEFEERQVAVLEQINKAL